MLINMQTRADDASVRSRLCSCTPIAALLQRGIDFQAAGGVTADFSAALHEQYHRDVSTRRSFVS